MKNQCGVWTEVEPQIVEKWSLSDDETDCSFSDIFINESHPIMPPLLSVSNPIECVVVDDYYDDWESSGDYSPYDSQYSGVYYILLDNGELWMWKVERGHYDKLFMELAGGFFGIFVGYIIRIIILRQKTRSEQEDLNRGIE